MSTEHADISREHSAVLRTMLQVALQVSEQLVRRREQRIREATAVSERHARELTTRLRTEQSSAETALRAVHRDHWWAAAAPEQIGQQMRLAHTWKDRSPVAADAAEVIDEQLRARYNITRSRENLDMAAVSAAVQRDISIQQRRDAAAAQYTADGFTVLDEQPRGPGFVSAEYLLGVDVDVNPDDITDYHVTRVDLTDDRIHSAPSAWAVHLSYSRSTDTVVPHFYCTDRQLASVTPVDPTTAHQFDDLYLDSADALALDELLRVADDAAKDYVGERIRQRYGVDVANFGPDEGTHFVVYTHLEDIERARDNPAAAQIEAAGADRARAYGNVVDSEDELDRDQRAAAWQWLSSTEPRHAEYLLYSAPYSDIGPFASYQEHLAEQWAQTQPDRFGDSPRRYYDNDITQAWIQDPGTDYPRLHPEQTREVFGPPPPVTTTDLGTVTEWSAAHNPRDLERYDKSTGPQKSAAEKELRLRFDVDHARAWANDHAPALAVSFTDAESSPDRGAYLASRSELIDAWNAAQRPIGAELNSGATAAAPATPDTYRSRAQDQPAAAAYDTAERRDADAQALREAGVDEDAIRAHSIAEISAALPAADIVKSAGTSGPRASKGDRSASQEATRDRGSR